MQFEESVVWLSNVLPGEVQLVPDIPADRPAFMVAQTQADADTQLACTTDFQRIDTGVSFQERTVRCELMCLTYSDQELATALVRSTGRHLARLQGLIPAQPGTIVEGLGEVAKLPDTIHTRDAVLVGPTLWEGQTPQYLETQQLTLLLQIVPVTPDELIFAKTYGVGELLQQMAREQVDFLDWTRT